MPGKAEKPGEGKGKFVPKHPTQLGGGEDLDDEEKEDAAAITFVISRLACAASESLERHASEAVRVLE